MPKLQTQTTNGKFKLDIHHLKIGRTLERQQENGLQIQTKRFASKN